jgi:hypothetical protein
LSEEIGLDESIHGEHAYEALEVEEAFNGNRSSRPVEHITEKKEVEEWDLVGPRK